MINIAVMTLWCTIEKVHECASDKMDKYAGLRVASLAYMSPGCSYGQNILSSQSGKFVKILISDVTELVCNRSVHGLCCI